MALALGLSQSPSSAQSVERSWAVGVGLAVTHPPPCLVWSCDSDPGPALGLDLTGELSFGSTLAGYVSVTRYGLRFNTGRTSAARGGAVGFRLGTGRGPWGGLGLIVHQRQFRDPPGGAGQAWSDFGFGTEAMGGWAVPFSSRLTVSPTVLYRIFSAKARASTSVTTSSYWLMLAVRLSG